MMQRRNALNAANFILLLLLSLISVHGLPAQSNASFNIGQGPEWMLFLRKPGPPSTNTASIICGATMVAHRLALTAARMANFCFCVCARVR